ncbi:MAG: hypothetical protein JSS14_04975 [Proteobacteria bacterium]|nr:hypothetical protein [Pseudomonadota bacterium]
MSLEMCIALGLITVGVLLAMTGQEICQNLCWVDKAVDFVLPDALDSFSGGIPIIVVGLVLLGNAWRNR